ncbi:MAG: YjgP/YjgQ family permease [candidate division WS1 bacterium]|jgi:lipopolysaccharide export system permease protein|nr:YjgP/YjgQ family permease [candidate division WS1 bacterium]
MRLLDRHLLRSVALPFVIGLLLFVLILLAEVAYNISSTIVGGRVSVDLIIRYLLLRTPRAIVWSLPFGTLLGVAMAITSLAHYGEITAIRAGGVSFGRICASLIFLGAIAGAAGIALNQYVVPGTMEAAQTTLAEMMMTQPVVREAHNQFFRDEQGRFFFVGDMLPAENLLRQVTIWTRDKGGRVRSIVVAERAELRGQVWDLRDGASVTLDERGSVVGRIEQFDSREVMLTSALQHYYAEQRSAAELAPHELVELIEVREQTGADTQQLQVYLHFKYSIPGACLVFALIAAPLGHRYARRGTYVGVVVAILVVFLYNGLRSWTLAFGLAGALDPLVAGWAPDLIFGIAGLILLATEG